MNRVSISTNKYGNPKARVPKGGVFDFNNDPAAKAFPYLGYDAMVPGPEDFYFGAEYLRQLGNYWNDFRVKDPTKAPKLLASNLVSWGIYLTPVAPICCGFRWFHVPPTMPL